MAKIRISVIIPTHDWSTLKRSLLSIKKQTLIPHEIIVVDNASKKNDYEKIRRLGVKIYRNEVNLGAAGGRNSGIEQASKKSNYLFFFDHDMVADKFMLEELVKVAGANRKIGIVTPRIYYLSDKRRIWSAGTNINLLTGRITFRSGKDVGQYEISEEVQVAPAALLVKRQVIDKVGGFDDIYFATYEDTDFCFRAKRAGFLTYYSPRAIAYHDTPADFRKESERLLTRTYWVGRNRIIFLKRFGYKTSLLFTPVYMFYYLMLALRFNRINAFFDFMKGTITGFLT